jgi:NADH:ubiquinone oxidoreductase subunit D
LVELEVKAAELLNFVEHEKSFRARTKGIAHLGLDDIKRYCVVGPVARASGLDIDMRRDEPYAAYEKLDFRVHVMTEGDVWARAIVRLLEMVESVRLCRQILKNLPEGPVATSSARRVPAGEAVSRCEGPRGEVLYFIQSDGSQNPARLKIRTPSLTNLITLPLQLKGVNMADVSVVISGVDLCIACADR